jgi:NNP family nitrate/nitrite transporter-like MFS transporter
MSLTILARYIMAGILIAGAIPSGLASVISGKTGLYVIRFFIGILGATFVPCVVWSTQMFDKNIVGTANALTAGWGNAGGGATYAIMVSLYNRLRKHTTQHRAWRLAFVCVPVPVLVTVAVATLVFGTDCPQGKWSLRHTSPATRAAVLAGHEVHLDSREREAVMNKKRTEGDMQVREVDMDAPEPVQDTRGQETVIRSDIDVAVAEPLTMKTFVAVLANPITWLPTLAYMTTFGFELAVDSNLASVLLAPHPTLGQLNAGYLASIFGLLNIITRPLGGYFADLLYRKYGTPAVKKHFVLALGCLQGVLTLGFGGLLISSKSPSLAGMMILIVCIAFCNEFANGANFSLVPHANSFNSGFMSGMVGAAGNLGGVFYALMFRYLPQQGHGWLAAGGFALGVNALLFLLPSPKR